MPELTQELILASGSPRRREILGQLGIEFRVMPSQVDERQYPGEPADQMARRLAAAKAEEVAAHLGTAARPDRAASGAFVLGADTVVVLDSEVLGKPDNKAAATEMLQRLSGRTHEVITAVALVCAGSAFRDEEMVSTRVSFRPLDAGTVARYVASGEGRDKAGSYAIQGLGAGLVSEIQGSYSNVVGLPATHTLDLLARAGLLMSWP